MQWCPEGDLNPHGRLRPADFKPRARPNDSAMPRYTALFPSKLNTPHATERGAIPRYTAKCCALRRVSPRTASERKEAVA
jgi:hypothetical protein